MGHHSQSIVLEIFKSISPPERLAAPPISSLRELEYAAGQVEDNADSDDPNYVKWLAMLMAPGSSLGGARPKASVADEEGRLIC
jgi:serine/threonine-protein kinase HipA